MKILLPSALSTVISFRNNKVISFRNKAAQGQLRDRERRFLHSISFTKVSFQLPQRRHAPAPVSQPQLGRTGEQVGRAPAGNRRGQQPLPVHLAANPSIQ